MNKKLSIGILGGGQLGMMLCQASKEIGINTHIYCPDEYSPAKHYSNKFTCEDYLNEKEIIKWEKDDQVEVLGQLLSKNLRMQIEKEINDEVEQSMIYADQSPFPPEEELSRHVYK